MRSDLDANTRSVDQYELETYHKSRNPRAKENSLDSQTSRLMGVRRALGTRAPICGGLGGKKKELGNIEKQIIIADLRLPSPACEE